MKVTKYTHACLILEDGNSRIVIDPGSFTELPDKLSDIVGVIVTEEHYDHFDPEKLKLILQQSPNAMIYTTQNVSDELAKSNIQATAVSGRQTLQIQNFTLTFFETDHAPVYQVSPCKSLSVKINDYLYYPSDSYQTIGEEVYILALPTSGPWYKVSESIDFANSIKSKVVIVTHDAINSEIGNGVTNKFLESHLSNDRRFIHLKPGESFSEL